MSLAAHGGERSSRLRSLTGRNTLLLIASKSLWVTRIHRFKGKGNPLSQGKSSRLNEKKKEKMETARNAGETLPCGRSADRALSYTRDSW